MSPTTVRVDKRGRVTIPRTLSAALGLHPDDRALLEPEGTAALRFVRTNGPTQSELVGDTRLTDEEWESLLDGLAADSETLPLLEPEAYARESIYAGRV